MVGKCVKMFYFCNLVEPTLCDRYNIVRIKEINNEELITCDNLLVLNSELTWHQLFYSLLSNCGMTRCIAQAFSVDCLLYATLLYKSECLSYFIHLQHQSLHFWLLWIWFQEVKLQRHKSGVWSYAARGRYFGDNGIGSWDWLHFYSLFKDWSL